MGDVIVLAVLGIIVTLVIRGMWKNHKHGKSSCGCGGNCGGCSAGCSRKPF